MNGPQMDDGLFDKAVENVLDAPKHDLTAKIGSFDIASGTEDILYSPVDSTVIFGRLQDPEPKTTERAVEAAEEAFATWSKTGPSERKEILLKVAQELEKRTYRMAAEIVLSTGMARKPAFYDAVAAAEAVRRAAASCDVPGKPLGVWAVVSMLSSPLASAVGYAQFAIAAGNTVVLMPSGVCPRPVFSAFDIFRSAGLPPGVLNVMCDRSDRFVQELCDNLSVSGVVASGCGKAIEDLMFLSVNDELRFVNEVKGMNPVVVASPGDYGKAANAILESAQINSGAGLYACSKVLVRAEESGDVLAAITEKLKDLKVGDPTYADTVMGPLSGDRAEKRFLKVAEDNMQYLAHGGKKVKCEADGRYYVPLLLTGFDTEDEMLYEDKGIPMIILRPYAKMDDLLQELSETDCGMSVGVLSTDSKTVSAVRKFASEENLEVWGNEGSVRLMVNPKMCAEDFRK